MIKVIDIKKAMNYMKDGMTIMIGGFLGTGTPEIFIDEIVKRGIKNLTIISNDTGFPQIGVAKLIESKLAAKVIVSHIGTNPETKNQMQSGDLIVELIPQGTLAEQIRSGGAGIGGFLTETGVGTQVANGKHSMTIEGREYILEMPLKADIALIKASKADKSGNLYYNGAAQNFNPLMATAANIVFVEAEEIVEIGELDSNRIMTPSVYVDYVIRGDKNE